MASAGCQPRPPQTAASQRLRRLPAMASAGSQPGPPHAASHGLRTQLARTSAGSQPWPPQATSHSLRKLPARASAYQFNLPHPTIEARVSSLTSNSTSLRKIFLHFCTSTSL
ncbi:hypothetical protein KFK09_029368 [Dendrobium nobile]|uniref:Uncharacterized protein n=1 Tax=Dendrobium nobile TaxID=94219 RepID=A0A8T3A4Z5_DENNO|nr:hypothetical protein KFK09_029368 [Dendrobium nobile]